MTCWATRKAPASAPQNNTPLYYAGAGPPRQRWPRALRRERRGSVRHRLHPARLGSPRRRDGKRLHRRLGRRDRRLLEPGGPGSAPEARAVRGQHQLPAGVRHRRFPNPGRPGGLHLDALGGHHELPGFREPGGPGHDRRQAADVPARLASRLRPRLQRERLHAEAAPGAGRPAAGPVHREQRHRGECGPGVDGGGREVDVAARVWRQRQPVAGRLDRGRGHQPGAPRWAGSSRLRSLAPGQPRARPQPEPGPAADLSPLERRPAAPGRAERGLLRGASRPRRAGETPRSSPGSGTAGCAFPRPLGWVSPSVRRRAGPWRWT